MREKAWLCTRLAEMKRCGLEAFAIYFHPRTPLHVVSRRCGTVLAVHSVPGTRPRAGPLGQGRRLRVGLADRVQALLLFLVVATANINPPRVWLGQEQPVRYLLRNVQIVQYASEICLLVLVVSFIFRFVRILYMNSNEFN